MTSIVPIVDFHSRTLSPAEKQVLIDKISKAKTSLILDHPFFGAIALNMPTLFDSTILTACTNGKHIKYNPDFLGSLRDAQVTFLVAHECFHPMLEHIWRLMGRDPQLWNIAGDIVINQILTNEGIGEFIEGGILDEDLYNAGDGNTDSIYNLLPPMPKGTTWRYTQGGIGDDIEAPDGSPAEQAQEQAEWRIKIAQAAQAAKMCGKLSGDMERLVGSILNAKVPWETLLFRFFEKATSGMRTFARPNRRFIQQGIYLPTATGVQLGDIVFAVDCSGSVSDDDIDQAAAEVIKVHEELRPKKLHVVYFDSRVSHMDTFEPDDDVTVTSHGGGGTAFSPIWDYIYDNDIDPVACVVLTDLVCYDFGDEPDYPVLWVSTHSDQADFGEVVMM